MSSPTRSCTAALASLLRAKLESEAKTTLNKNVRECIEYVLDPERWNSETCMLCCVCKRGKSLCLSPLRKYAFTLWVDKETDATDAIVAEFEKRATSSTTPKKTYGSRRTTT